MVSKEKKIRTFTTVGDVQVPTFLYGTAWKEERTEQFTFKAIKSGFRGVDTANQRKHYYEAGVGAALKRAFDDNLISRKDLFLQTKFTFLNGQDERLPYDKNAAIGEQVKQSVESSLNHLHVEYLDSYVLHGPSTWEGLAADDYEAWKAMEELYEEGKVRLLGVSNVNSDQLQLLYEKATVKPSVVQIRTYARNRWEKDIRQFCQEKGILYEGFSLLTANRNELANPAIDEIVQRRKITLPQLVFRFALQIGIVPLTGTTKEEHMKTDLAIYDFSLTEEEIKTIEDIAF